MLLSRHLPWSGPFFSSGRCPSRGSVHSCVTFVSSQSQSKLICLFGSPRPACQKGKPWGLAATLGRPHNNTGSVPPADRVLPLLRLHQLIPTAGPLYLPFYPCGSFPPKPQPCWLLHTITSQLKCHPDLKI